MFFGCCCCYYYYSYYYCSSSSCCCFQAMICFEERVLQPSTHDLFTLVLKTVKQLDQLIPLSQVVSPPISLSPAQPRHFTMTFGTLARRAMDSFQTGKTSSSVLTKPEVDSVWSASRNFWDAKVDAMSESSGRRLGGAEWLKMPNLRMHCFCGDLSPQKKPPVVLEMVPVVLFPLQHLQHHRLESQAPWPEDMRGVSTILQPWVLLIGTSSGVEAWVGRQSRAQRICSPRVAAGMVMKNVMVSDMAEQNPNAFTLSIEFRSLPVHRNQKKRKQGRNNSDNSSL